MNIFIEKETEDTLELDYESVIQEVVTFVADYEKCPYEFEVNVTLTDNEGIHTINKEYRQIDSPTDVLSFPLVEYSTPGDFSHLEEDTIECFNLDTGELMLGDIIISVDKVKEQAKEYGHSIRRELAFLVVHSMLHLFGYDHMEEEERIIMEGKQRTILELAGYKREEE